MKNLPRLREIGFGANRRVLELEKVSHDSQVGAEVLEKMQKTLEVEGQHASAMRFGDPRVQALLSILLLFAWQPEGVRNRQLRPLVAQCLGVAESQVTQGKMSYDLRRLRLHGIIERIEGTHRYRLSAAGMKTAFLYSRALSPSATARSFPAFTPKITPRIPSSKPFTSSNAKSIIIMQTKSQLERVHLSTLNFRIQGL